MECGVQVYRRSLGLARAVVPKVGRRLPGDLAEDPVKMRQGLETDGVRNLTDTEVRILQEILCLFHSDAPEVISEGQARSFLKYLAKVESAHMHRARDLIKIDWITVVARDIGLGPANHRRLGFRVLDRYSICHGRKLLAKDFQKADESRVLLLRKHSGTVVGVL